MSIRRFALLLLGSLVVGAAWSQTRDRCREEYGNLSTAIVGLMRDGENEHRVMLREVQRLQARHANGPADCRSNLLVEELMLTNFLDDYPGAIRLSDAYLASAFAKAFPDHRAFVLRVRGYARESLGETVAGAQDYFEAASLAGHLPVDYALIALLDAAETAIAMGDLDAAERYHADGERILVDSLDRHPSMRLRLGRLQTAQTGLLTLRIQREPNPVRRQALARTLQAVADSAASMLARNRPLSHDVRIDRANEALAWSASAIAASTLGRERRSREAIQEAIRFLEASDGTSRDAGHTVWMRAAEVYTRQGDMEAAHRAAERARDEGIRTGIVAQEAAGLEKLASLAETRGSLDHAEALYRQALALREVERERLELQDWSVSMFAASQAPYRGLARLLAGRGRVEEAFLVLDQSRARHLRELRAQVRLRERLRPQQRLRVDSLLTAIETARLEQLRSPDQAAQSRAAVAVRISRLQAALHAETDLYSAPAISLDLAALKRVLRSEQRALVSYLLGEQESFAFVVTADSVSVRGLPVTQGHVERLLREARGPWAAMPDPAVVLAPLHQLHEGLIRPIAPLLPPGQGLVVIPDGSLADVPFAMLVEAPATQYEQARYLVRRRAVSTDLAAALVLEDGEDRHATDPSPSPSDEVDVVAFGRSHFSESEGALHRRSGEPLADLPFVEQEIRRVVATARNYTVALNADATEPALRHALKTGRIVHIASHAEADPTFPMHSRIHLWPSPGDDGILHLYEIQSQHTPADLVVLSGCSTADGQAQRGEGTIGLHYGLRTAGAQATLASLWPVDDRAMAFITSAFYKGLARGLTKSHALQTAQVAYLDAHTGLDASPFYWASLVLSGNVSPVVLDAPRPRARRLGIAVVLLALSGLAWMATRRRHARRSDPAL